jgi:hypothetical protein
MDLININTGLGWWFPFFFVGMWVLVTFIISRVGWSKLADNYEMIEPFTGQRVGIISASINNANYNNSIILKYNEAGLYLKPIILFRLFHKPILIPWKEIKEVRDRNILLFSYKELMVGNPLIAKIKLKKSTFSKFENNLLSSMTSNENYKSQKDLF